MLTEWRSEVWSKWLQSKVAPRFDGSQIVTALYRTILKRNPDAGELQAQIKTIQASGIDGTVRVLLESIELQRVERSNPLWIHRQSLWDYTARYDPVQTIL